jgi:hypothetical protein
MRFGRFSCVLGLLALPGTAWAADAGTATATTAAPVAGDVVQASGALLEALMQKNWTVAAGLALSILIWVLRTTGVLDKVKLGSKWGIRASTVILAVIGSLSVSLVTGMPPAEVAVSAVQVAVAAVGGWEFFGKLIRDVTTKSAPAPAPAAPSGPE